MNATTRNPAAAAGGIAMAFAALALMGVSAAEAAPAAPAATKVAEATTVQVQPSLAVDTADDAANCSRARRRLWVDGEGWIVRRITTCR